MWEVVWLFQTNLFAFPWLLVCLSLCDSIFSHLIFPSLLFLVVSAVFKCYSCVPKLAMKISLEGTFSCSVNPCWWNRHAVEMLKVLSHAALSAACSSLKATCVEQHGDTFNVSPQVQSWFFWIRLVSQGFNLVDLKGHNLFTVVLFYNVIFIKIILFIRKVNYPANRPKNDKLTREECKPDNLKHLNVQVKPQRECCAASVKVCEVFYTPHLYRKDVWVTTEFGDVAILLYSNTIFSSCFFYY